MESHDHDSKDNDSAKASWKGIMGGTAEVRGWKKLWRTSWSRIS